MAESAMRLIDRLIALWNMWECYEQYYLHELAPKLLEYDTATRLSVDEKRIARELKRLLSPEEWQRLPELIASRRNKTLDSIGSDIVRSQAELEAQRLAYEAATIEEERRREQDRQRRLAESVRATELLRSLEQEQREKEERARAQENQRRRDEQRKRELENHLAEIFQSDFLYADQWLAAQPNAALLQHSEYQKLKSGFVEKWARETLHQELDDEQAAAIANTQGNILVVARAGSGKTRTLVTRALFLQKHCGVSANEMLLVAFNKVAAEEMKERLEQTLGSSVPHVMTFHALAHALIHPEEKIVYDDLSADQLGHSRLVQAVIDTHIHSRDHSSQIRELMLGYFREDWERIVAGEYHLDMDEFLAQRRFLTSESLRGDYVKSFGEKVIANALFEFGVDYQYESNFRWDGVNYRPDFKIPLGPQEGIIIEYFGLRGEPDYDKMSDEKRRFWSSKEGWTLLEYCPSDLGSLGTNHFVDRLLHDLKGHGVEIRRRSEEEIWELVKERALDSFTSAMRTFIGRCRKYNLSREALELRSRTHEPRSDVEKEFLAVGIAILGSYLHRLAQDYLEDFDGLVWRAIAAVNENKVRFIRDAGREQGNLTSLRFILIDEYQDFSEMFYAFVSAIQAVNQDVRFFCVGDDWQAINAFAGSDLRYFKDFHKYFDTPQQLMIATNYRSPVSIVRLGNAVMSGQGKGARPRPMPENGWVSVARMDDFTPSAIEQSRHGNDEITPALLRLIGHFIDRDQNVVLLSRSNTVPWNVSYRGDFANEKNDLDHFCEHLRSFFPKEERRRITISTAHRYKGLEQTVVVVLDAVARRYPLIHPHWVFTRIFGDDLGKISEDEKRLFYVALTRAKKSLILLTEDGIESPFLLAANEICPLDTLHWSSYPALPSQDAQHVEIRVFHAYAVRQQLSDRGYRFNHDLKCWCKAVLAERFSVDLLQDRPWFSKQVRVQVLSDSGDVLHEF